MGNSTGDESVFGKTADLEPQSIGVRKKRWVVCFENAILDLDLSIYEKMIYIVLCSHAKKDGSCYPSVKKIAAEASCSRAKVFEALKTLEERGIIARNSQIFEGRGQTSNLYEILDINPRPQDGRGEGASLPPSTSETGASAVQTGASTLETGASTTCTGGVHDADTNNKVLEQYHMNNTKEQKSPLPTREERGWEIESENSKTENQKPDTEEKNRNAKPTSNCPELFPYTAILAAYNEILSELPRAEVLTTSRTQTLNLRISEDSGRQNLDWWRRFFERVRLFPWLMGRNPNNWTATFDWLIAEDGMRKVIEGSFTQTQRTEYSREELLEWQRKYTDEEGIVDAQALLRDWQAKTAGRR